MAQPFLPSGLMRPREAKAEDSDSDANDTGKEVQDHGITNVVLRVVRRVGMENVGRDPRALSAILAWCCAV